MTYRVGPNPTLLFRPQQEFELGYRAHGTASRCASALRPQVLLLGPGEAGKSTVLKQLKCIYKGGIPLAEQRVSAMMPVRRGPCT